MTKAIEEVPVLTKESKKIKIPEEDLDLIRKALRYPVAEETGTANFLNIEGLEVCAKTGTAQVAHGASHGWVAGFFPLHQPRYAFCVLLENAGTSHAAVQLGRAFFDEALKRRKLY